MQPTRLFDIMDQQAQEQPLAACLNAKVDGRWQPVSSAELISRSRHLSIGLLSLGLTKGERVALIANNRPEWIYTDQALCQLGCPSVPIYPTAASGDFEYILGHSEARYLMVSSKSIYDKIQALRSKLPKLKEVYTFDQVPGAKHWQELMDAGANASPSLLAAHAKARSEVTPEDLASVIYTSGTTGRPKGVMLTHQNFLANVLAVEQVIKPAGYPTALSFLPLSHVFERVVSYYYLRNRIAISFAESMDTIAKNIQEVQPSTFVCVPRVLEKLYDAIVAKGRELTGSKRAIFDWALELGLAYDPNAPQSPFSALKLALARRLIFSKWKAALGGKLELVIVGGSALQPRLARVFWAAGLKVVEGYGLTETSPVIAVNTPEAHRIGTVGKVLANLKVKIHPEAGYRPEEGEILVKGPSVMAGYYNNPEATMEAIDKDGFFHTGDIGLVENGYLRITDRKKEMFKTSGGKYVAPLALENKFRESPYIGQLIVIGEHRKFPCAIVVPEFAALETWVKREGLSFASHDQMIADPKVKALYDGEIARLNQVFGRWEQVKQFRLVSDEWSVHTGELTPKLSLKRKIIEAKYKDLVEQIYAYAEAHPVHSGH